MKWTMSYNFKKGMNDTVIIREVEFDHLPMNADELRAKIQVTRLHRDQFTDEGQFRNHILMLELALKFLLEEQA